MSYHQQNNNYYYGANSRPQPPRPPHQPAQAPARPPTSGFAGDPNRDPRTASNYGQPYAQYQNQYGGYSQASPPSAYSQVPMQGRRLPYPTHQYDASPPPSSSPPMNQYPPQHPAYNPQHYAQAAPASYAYNSGAQPSYAPAPPPRPPQPYNPAVYAPSSNYQDNAIAAAANRMYGPTTGHTSPNQSGSWNSTMSPTMSQHPASGGYPSAQYSHHSRSDSSPQPAQPQAVSAPLPSRTFPRSPVPEHQRDSGSSYSGSSETLPRYPSPPPQASSSPPRHSPQVPRQDDSLNTPDSYLHYQHSGQHSVSPSRNYGGTNHTDQHPQSRPLPGPPFLEPDSAPTYTATSEPAHDYYYSDDIDQDQLFDELEIAWRGPDPIPSEQHHEYVRESGDSVSLENRHSARGGWDHDESVNGHQGPQSSTEQYSDYSDDSDAEATLGLKAMALAAEQEFAEQRRRESSGTNARTQNYRQPPPSYDVQEDEGSFSGDEGDAIIDLSSIGGGWQPPVSYGTDQSAPTSAPANTGAALQLQHLSTSSRGSVPRSVDGYPAGSSSDTSLTDYSSVPPTAQVDQAGTGGFADPSWYLRKLSFDESSENIHYDGHATSGADMASGPPDLPYSSSVSMNRPLPLPPEQDQSASLNLHSDINNSENSQYPADVYTHQPMGTTSTSVQVPRTSTSVIHPSTSRPITPARAQTDGKRQTLRLSTFNVNAPTDQVAGLQTPSHVGIDIPSLPPGRRFYPSKLSDKDFENCTEPWALSSISSWLRDLAEGESELRENAIVEALVALFTAKIPNMNITIVEGLAANVFNEMITAGVLVHEEEWLRFGRGSMNGVLYQLTGSGCYSSYLHLHETSGRCYSPHCLQMVKKVSLQGQRTSQSVDWATCYNLSKETLDQADKKAIEFQHNLHEIVTSEDIYMDQLQVLGSVYRDGICAANPAIIAPQMLNGFVRDVFGKLNAVKEANEEHLLPQLKYRQQEQGPWIVGFSDIFRHWIRKAKAAYIEYAANFPNANFLMKREESRNTMFAAFVESARNNKMSNRLEWSSFLRAPITRLQRYSLLLATAQKHMTPENATEASDLQLALEEIRAVTMECDARVAESGKKADLHDLHTRLILRPEMKGVELNLQQFGRKILFRGDLQRTGGSRFTWLQTHAILLDNYLVLAKTIVNKDSSSDPRYDISKAPIPMDLLILESSNDDPVEKSYKGYSSVTHASSDARPAKPGSISTPGGLTQTMTNSSVSTTDSASSGKTMVTTTVLSDGSIEGRILYPFRVKHLGRETYTLYASSVETRRSWCEKIIDAKAEHATSLHVQNAEPFKLRVIADSAFAYDTYSGGQKSILIKGSPLSRAVSEVEKMYDHKGRPGPICRARVNCATTFAQPNGTPMLAIGTDYGVYISERGNPRGWSRAIPVVKVTQISVLEEFNLFLLISDKSLIAYHLDVICPPSGIPASNDSVRKAPQKLSGSRDVGFFVTGKMKDRTLVFYKKGSMSSTFKILEPILQRVPERRTRGLLNRGNTDFFREYDDFYIPAECTSLDVFNSTLSVATSKGLEVLNLDKKTPWSVPDLKAPHVATIAARLSGVNPLAMFRLDELEFLCVYEDCAVYVNKHGDISRSVVMEFVGKAKAAALECGYLILFDQDFVEIRNAQAGSLKQVIAGRDIRCLDNGRGVITSHNSGPRTIKLALQHPEYERTQVVVELLLDETRRL